MYIVIVIINSLTTLETRSETIEKNSLVALYLAIQGVSQRFISHRHPFAYYMNLYLTILSHIHIPLCLARVKI